MRESIARKLLRLLRSDALHRVQMFWLGKNV